MITASDIQNMFLTAPGDDNHANLIAELNAEIGLDPNDPNAYTADEILILGGDGGLEVVLWGSRDNIKHSLRKWLGELEAGEAAADTDEN